MGLYSEELIASWWIYYNTDQRTISNILLFQNLNTTIWRFSQTQPKVKVKIKPTILTHMERRIKCLIRFSTGWDISFHPSTRLSFPHLIQIPPRAFSHRSSSHVFTLTRTLGSERGPAYIRSEWYSFCIRAFLLLGGQVGLEPTNSEEGGFTIRSHCR